MDDLISRQASIATMKNYIARWSEYAAVGDTISRQAAIDAILHNQEVYSNNFGDDPIDKYTIAIIDNDAQTIAQLPSVQPELAKRIVGKSRDGMTLWYQCDMCNEPVDAQDNYCRGCGRRLIDG